MRRLVLELSLKTFPRTGDAEIREVCRDILRQWQALVHEAEEIAFLIWAADGSEILDYRGRLSDRFEWAQWIGTCLPNTHFLRIVRGILLKGNGAAEIAPEIWPLIAFLVVAMAIGVKRYRQTLD